MRSIPLSRPLVNWNRLLEMKPDRTRRVGQLLKRELAQLLSTPKVKPRSFFLTVTEVKLSRDLKYADVWVSVLGDEKNRQHAISFLTDNSQRMRYMLANNVRLRHIPELTFRLDETLDKAERIDNLLRESGIEVDEPDETGSADE